MRRKTETGGVVPFAVLVVFVVLALAVPRLSPYAFDAQDIGARNMGVSVQHWFGTDRFGRDIFTRVCCGLEISLRVGVLCALICFAAGVFIGSLAGFGNNLIDSVLLELMNIVSAVPSMLYVILTLLVFDAGIGSVALGFGIFGWVDLAKMVRVETKRLRQKDFCIAAEMMGVPFRRMLLKYILPNEKELLIVQTIQLVPRAVFMEAFLSFLGIGIAAPRASLGMLIQDAKLMIFRYPMQMLFPAVVLALLIVCLQSIGYMLENRNRYQMEIPEKGEK